MKGQPPLQAWCDVINTNLIGTINAIQVALPHLGEGASIIATGSTAALMDTHKKRRPGQRPGRHGVRDREARCCRKYVHDLATELGATGHSRQRRAPDELQHRHAAERTDVQVLPARPERTRQRADAEPVFYVQQAMKVPYIEPEDISNAVLWLASDEARYVTGMQLRVDAGGYLKWYDYHI